MADDREPRTISDPKALRALAHPLRWQLMEFLELEGSATATRCAEATDESVASCSYHLNVLAKYGFIEEAQGGIGREKPWRLTGHDQSWAAGGEGLDVESALAAQALSDAVLDHHHAHLKTWLRRRSREEQRWLEATGITRGLAFVTDQELAQLTAELRMIVNRYADRLEDPGLRPPGARPAQIFVSTSLSRPPEAERGGTS
ncbi:helix-turn-helix domain-containing protein [Pseudonocardia yunnanensis]|uniref:ArsR/SmtB family transcription factor n=1 Tax=Pseudonocardia yunnanensis TaxID=58107 RepID=A0ABW4F9K5_9PSEU